ncbi:MAG: AAA family ATPase [Planctomycetaceae bacterium]|nr:AAA family ATPase [Planctomycetaceae bacterium]
MKIDSVAFQNLNSLTGTSKISFANTTGVFAIVGPTGVGKTTILDAICLALYGRTPRLSRVSKDNNEIISRNKKFCFAEVQFETNNNEKYIARWEHDKNRKSNDPVHRLYRCLDGEGKELLHTGIQNVQKNIPQIIGLDFTQFTRSVMLAQGEFATFLHCNDSERASILEKITGTEIYKDISIKVHEKFKDNESNLKRCQEKLNEIKTLAPDELDLLICEIKKLDDEIKQHTEKQNSINEFLTYHKKLKEIQNESETIKRNIESLDESEAAFFADAVKLANARKANEISNLYNEYSTQKKLLNETIENITKTENNIPAAKIEFNVAQKNADESDKLRAEAEANRDINQKKSINARAIDQKINELNTNLGKLKKDKKERTKKISTREKDLNKYEQILADVLQEKTPDLLKQKLDEVITAHAEILNNIPKPVWAVGFTHEQPLRDATLACPASGISKQLEYNNITNLIDELEKLRNDLASRKILYDSIVEVEIIVKSQIEIESQIKTLNNSIEQLENQESKLEDQKILTEKYISQLREKKQLLAVIASLEEHRVKLENGKPCPLCGACEHPYTNGIPKPVWAVGFAPEQPLRDATLECSASGILKQLEYNNPKINDEEIEIKKTEKEINNINKELKSINEKLDTAKRERDKLKIKHNNNIKSLKQLADKSGVGEADNFPDKEIVQTEIGQINDAAAKIKKQIDDAEKLNNEQKELNEKLQKNHETNLEIEKIKTQIKEIKSENENTENEINLLESKLKSRKEERINCLGDEDPDEYDKKFDLILNSATKNHNKNTEFAINQKNKLENLTQQLITLIDTKLKRETETENAKKLFNEHCTEKGFESEIEFLQAKIENEKFNELQTKENQIKEERIRLNSLRDENNRKNKELSEQKIPQPNNLYNEIDLLQKEKDELDVKIKENAERVGGLKEKLNANEQKSEEIKIRQNEYDQTYQQYELWFKLNELIGSHNGTKYSRIVQKMTFQSLIVHANQQLSKISDRYFLSHAVAEDNKSTNNKELAFEVIDKHQGSIKRPTQNLSGGEVFLVSLSLALGLSSMMSERIRVDSLFLDEGFGTLDEQTLDTVLSVLDELRHTGKLIGIISHVPMIRQRITSQIRVLPNANGQSRIEIALEER